MDHERYKLNPPGRLMGLIPSLLWRIPSDRLLIPVIRRFSGKKVCDVGCGNGVYSRIFLDNNNTVTGVDLNPRLRGINMEVIRRDAADYAGVFERAPCDVVFSGWMTEYLSRDRLAAFFRQSYLALGDNGVFITTVISDKCWGKFYVTLAKKLRGVDKYSYPSALAEEMLKNAGFQEIKIVKMDSWFGIPWAMLFICRK